MKYRMVYMLCLMLLGMHSFAPADDTRRFRVIVHVSNPHSELTQKELSYFFLKKVTRWKDFDELVHPVDREEDSQIRKLFTLKIHRRKISAIKAYWQQQIFSGREIPPLEQSTDEDVLRFVSQKKGAIGYISMSVDLSAYKKVKVINIAADE